MGVNEAIRGEWLTVLQTGRDDGTRSHHSENRHELSANTDTFLLHVSSSEYHIIIHRQRCLHSDFIIRKQTIIMIKLKVVNIYKWLKQTQKTKKIHSDDLWMHSDVTPSVMPNTLSHRWELVLLLGPLRLGPAVGPFRLRRLHRVCLLLKTWSC